MPASKSLEDARRLVVNKLQGLPVRVWLFGSRTRGTASAASDIDLAILPKGTLPEGILSELREAFEESDIPYKVDVVDLRSVDGAFRRRIESEGVLWLD